MFVSALFQKPSNMRGKGSILKKTGRMRGEEGYEQETLKRRKQVGEREAQQGTEGPLRWAKQADVSTGPPPTQVQELGATEGLGDAGVEGGGKTGRKSVLERQTLPESSEPGGSRLHPSRRRWVSRRYLGPEPPRASPGQGTLGGGTGLRTGGLRASWHTEQRHPFLGGWGGAPRTWQPDLGPPPSRLGLELLSEKIDLMRKMTLGCSP
ncbi:hypothetical protein HJG60_011051 [Phyllostomus discolor]|uniref:Uncharacterized protein n=1 Tax=Phyllostomus discolor TaxID=89673 RepID=A0A834ACN6_9CHIR|nr:hypothetical protein HJG60_011051 [Phyllostomus discolor]